MTLPPTAAGEPDLSAQLAAAQKRIAELEERRDEYKREWESACERSEASWARERELRAWIEDRRVERWHATCDLALCGLLTRPQSQDLQNFEHCAIYAAELADQRHGPLTPAEPPKTAAEGVLPEGWTGSDGDYRHVSGAYVQSREEGKRWAWWRQAMEGACYSADWKPTRDEAMRAALGGDHA